MKYVFGLFDDAQHASLAEQKVAGLGKVEHITGSGSYGKLREYGLSGHDLDGFAEGIRRGGTLVRVHCDDKTAEEVRRIFCGLPAVDMNRRLERWRSAGWKGYDEKASLLGREEIERERAVGREDLYVPVIEESIAVGKREVERGGVRLETHVKETPFQQNVALHEEQVRVERHAVNRPVTAADQIGDKVIEVRARGEEAVVQKQARVVEEITLKKEASTRNEQITDTIKKTEVDVKPIAGEKRVSRTDIDRTSRTSQI
jgi:uncharacterized protein (TIGR02271 family)